LLISNTYYDDMTIKMVMMAQLPFLHDLFITTTYTVLR